jgi:hypothetical protein
VVSVTLRPRFSPVERAPGNHWTGGWVGPRAGLDTEARGEILSPLPGIVPRSPGHPVHARHYILTELPGSFSHLPFTPNLGMLKCALDTILMYFSQSSQLPTPDTPQARDRQLFSFLVTDNYEELIICTIGYTVSFYIKEMRISKHRCRVVNTHASYSKGPVFKSRPGDRVSLLSSLWFSSVSPGEC